MKEKRAKQIALRGLLIYKSFTALVLFMVLFLTSSASLDIRPPLPMKNGKPDLSKIYGKIKLVDHFPDYKVQVVSHFADLHVQVVEHFPDRPGKWKMVEHFPDFKIKLVEHFPDFKIKYVQHFPGVQ